MSNHDQHIIELSKMCVKYHFDDHNVDEQLDAASQLCDNLSVLLPNLKTSFVTEKEVLSKPTDNDKEVMVISLPRTSHILSIMSGRLKHLGLTDEATILLAMAKHVFDASEDLSELIDSLNNSLSELQDDLNSHLS